MQIDGARAWDEILAIDVVMTDPDSALRLRLRLRNGVLTCNSTLPGGESAQAVVNTPRRSVTTLAAPDRGRGAGAQITGDTTAVDRLFALLDPADPDFAIVTP